MHLSCKHYPIRTEIYKADDTYNRRAVSISNAHDDDDTGNNSFDCRGNSSFIVKNLVFTDIFACNQDSQYVKWKWVIAVGSSSGLAPEMCRVPNRNPTHLRNSRSCFKFHGQIQDALRRNLRRHPQLPPPRPSRYWSRRFRVRFMSVLSDAI